MSNLRDKAMQAAERYVEHLGYDVVGMAYKLKDGEQIDIVAEDGDALVFIDVKARCDADKGFPSENMTKHLTKAELEREICSMIETRGARRPPYSGSEARGWAIATVRSASTASRFWCWRPTEPS